MQYCIVLFNSVWLQRKCRATTVVKTMFRSGTEGDRNAKDSNEVTKKGQSKNSEKKK